MDEIKNPVVEMCFLTASSFWVPEWVPEVSAWFEHGPFAFWITEAHRPRSIVELGTHLGFSYLAFCQSVKRHQIDCRCYAVDTWKGDAQAGFYEENVFTRVNDFNSQNYSHFSTLIRSTFDQALERFADGSIDLLHLDGLHTYESVKHDFETWLPKMSKRGIILFHDTNVRESNFGVWRLWQELSGNYPNFEFWHGHGLGVLGVGGEFAPVIQKLFALKQNSIAAENVRSAYAHLGKMPAMKMLRAENAGLSAENAGLSAENEKFKSAMAALNEENARLRAIVASAEAWQSSWLKRSFHRWRPSGVRTNKAGLLRRLERSIRKRRKLFLMRTMYPFSPRAAEFQASSRFAGPASRFQPLITIIVPNFNHAPYLRKRLDCIFTQTYQNFRVLLLDDGSTDGSQFILREYAGRFPDKTELHLNPVNRGKVFSQWKRGIELAKTELIWIAESDDFCTRDLLGELVPYFRDEAVQLAYGRTVFVGKDGNPISFTFEGYVSRLDKSKWAKSYVQSAHQEVGSALGIINTIPNVSSVVFRNPGPIELLEDPEWLNMKITGDWVFYLHLLRGGKIAFTPKAVNYYRYHGGNASVSTHKQPVYFREHEMVAVAVQRLYAVPETTLQRFSQFLNQQWNAVFNEASRPAWKLEDEFQVARIVAGASRRLPNVLMACHDFAGGGGEMFPIRLAVALKERGFGVTFIDFEGIKGSQFRKLLPPHIPVIQIGEYHAEISQIFQDFGIEIVHSHHMSIDRQIAEQLRPKGSGPKHLVTMHGMYELDRESTAECLPMLMKCVDRWVYTAEKNLKPFKDMGCFASHKFAGIGLGMPRPVIHPVQRSTLQIKDEAFVVCVASRAIPEKGWAESIAAVNLSREKTGRDIQLLLIGNGPIYDALQKQTLPSYVHLLGFKLNPVDYYAMADLGLLASNYKAESFPMSIVECLMAGRPVVASDLGEIRNMLTVSTGRIAGLLFPVADGEIPVETISTALDAFILDQALYAAASACAGEAANKFEMAQVVDQYAKLYSELLSVAE